MNGAQPIEQQELVADGSPWPCRASGDGLSERPDAESSLDPGGAQHGPGLENPAEPSACPAMQLDLGSNDSNLEGVRLGRDGLDGPEGNACSGERVAPLGAQQDRRRQSVHPKEQAGEAVVTSPGVLCGPVSTGNVMLLLEHQEYRCALTGRHLTPGTASLDHVIPIRCGGEHVIENTQVLHREVNRAKGSLSNEEFIALCDEVTRWCRPAANEEA
jgi:5-methylcytosine-specific restriction endonuclease McrA